VMMSGGERPTATPVKAEIIAAEILKTNWE